MITTQFQISPEKEKPDIDHIAEAAWGRVEQITQQAETPKETQTTRTHEKANMINVNISPDLQQIRNKALLTQTMAKHPRINKWLTEDYAEKEVRTTIQQLKITHPMDKMEHPDQHIKHLIPGSINPSQPS